MFNIYLEYTDHRKTTATVVARVLLSVLHVNIYVWGCGLVQIQGYKLIVLCSWVGRFTHTVASSTQEYINLVLTNCWATRHIACRGGV